MRVSGSSTWRQCDWEITPQRFARGYVPGHELAARAPLRFGHEPCGEDHGTPRRMKIQVCASTSTRWGFGGTTRSGSRASTTDLSPPEGRIYRFGPDADRAPASDNRVPGPLPGARLTRAIGGAAAAEHAPRRRDAQAAVQVPLRNTGRPRDDGPARQPVVWPRAGHLAAGRRRTRGLLRS